MNDPIPDFARNLFTPEARREFSIAGIAAESADEVRFRLDPGPAFERTGRIIRTPSDGTILRLLQRYRPDREMTVAAGAPLGGSLSDGLRSVIRLVNWPTRRPHWRVAYPLREPRWVRVRTVTRTGIISEAFRAVTEAARKDSTAHFLWRAGDKKIAYGNNPPRDAVMFSVNPLGQWAFHAGRDTRPLETAPDLTTLATEPDRAARAAAVAAARLAAQDLLRTEAVTTVRSEESEAAPTDRPAPARPARGR